LLDFAFLVGVTSHVNYLNLKLQG